MAEILLAITMLCTKTNDLNMFAIGSRKRCVVKIMKCIKESKKHKWDTYIECIDPDSIKKEK